MDDFIGISDESMCLEENDHHEACQMMTELIVDKHSDKHHVVTSKH